MSNTEEMAPPVQARDVADPPRIDERYRIEKEIGRGGMGRVFVAHDRKLGRDVAIKVLASGLHGEEALRRFEQEARATCALNHPNILDVHDMGTHEGSPYIVSELLHGVTLRERLERGPVPVKEASGYAMQLAQGLSAAHEKGIVHRDLKPENLFITEEGRLKILDFGIAKLVATTIPEAGETLRSPRPRTETGAIVGTVAYMSPEQVRGEPADRRSDVFSLGVIFYEMLAGRSAFGRGTAVETGYAILNDDSPAVPADVPPELQRIVRRCLEKDPDKRFQSAQELALQLAQMPSSAAEAPAPPRTSRRRRALVMAAVALAASALAVVLLGRESRIRWAREQALPEITELVDKARYAEAFALAEKAEPIIPGDPTLMRRWREMSRIVSVETKPAGADVYWAEYDAPQFRYAGRSPLQIRVAGPPRGLGKVVFLRWRLTKQGFADVDAMWSNDRTTGEEWWTTGRFVLDTAGDIPAGMVRVPGGLTTLQITQLYYLPAIELPDYFIDRFEVTNRQFKQFVDAGGYRRRELWKYPFIDGGRTISFEEAVARFRDRTGRPGPATWVSGDHPDGQDDLPVTGVSWYEATAYAAFTGKSLPTIYHWNRAAGTWASEVIIPRSNFGGAGLLRVGSNRGFGPYGTYDMAGNAKEWCWNANGEKRYILGGSWNEPSYMFTDADARGPFERAPTHGFRLAKYLDEEKIPEAAKGPVATPRGPDFATEKPVPDAIFEAYRSLYAYDRADLRATVDAVDDSSDRFRREKVSFAAAYGNERVMAYVYTPKHGRPPYQPVVYFPASNAVSERSSDQIPQAASFSFVVKSGRAFIFPIYKSTYERGDGLRLDYHLAMTRLYRDHVIQWSKDLGRTLDYLESRADMDQRAVGYFGLSWGAAMAPIMLAVEPRIRAAVLVGGGFYPLKTLPEVDQLNFAPRAKQPVLLVNGRYDVILPVDSSQAPLFRSMGAPTQDKRHAVLESGHVPPNDLMMKEILDWFDRHLGPVR